MAKKKFTKKQLAAQRLFAKRAKAGTLKKKSKSNTKQITKSVSKSLKNIRKSEKEIKKQSKILDKLIEAIKDPKVKEIVFRK